LGFSSYKIRKESVVLSKVHTKFILLKITNLFVWFLVLTFSGFTFHPFYVSMTEILFNEKEKKLEVSVRIFTDDFEKALAKDCNCKTDLTKAEVSEKMKPLVKKYIEQHVQIFADGKKLSCEFLGFEKEEESTWSFLEIDCPSVPVHLEIKNNILHKIQNQQTNLIRFQKQNFDKTIQLSFPDTEARF
jgi:hypothetical protein